MTFFPNYIHTLETPVKSVHTENDVFNKEANTSYCKIELISLNLVLTISTILC